jgi:hypothetical protein
MQKVGYLSHKRNTGRCNTVPQGFLLLWMILNKVVMMPFAKKKKAVVNFNIMKKQ